MSVPQRARADGDGMRRPRGHLITGAGREEVLRKGVERRREACNACVMCVRPLATAVGVDVDAQGSGLRED